MSFLPLTLGVGSKADAEEGAKPLSKSAIEKILKRDDFTCRFCGFRSKQFQHILPFHDDTVTLCGFCEQVLRLERAGMMGSGVLLWLPEIAQADLNHIARAIYVARAENMEPLATAATRALDALMARRGDAKKRLGTDDPLMLATILLENLNEAEVNAAPQKLDGIRLMPLDKYLVRVKGGDINGFDQMVRFWRSEDGPYADMPVTDWQKLFAKVVT